MLTYTRNSLKAQFYAYEFHSVWPTLGTFIEPRSVPGIFHLGYLLNLPKQMARVCNPRTQEAKQEDCFEFNSSLGDLVSGWGRSKQKRNRINTIHFKHLYGMCLCV